MVTFTKTSFETQDLTEAYLMQTYMGKNVHTVKEDILNKYKGKGVDFVRIARTIVDLRTGTRNYLVDGELYHRTDKWINADMKKSMPKVVRLYADMGITTTKILFR